MQHLALFDLDFTLLEGDSESMWSSFMFDQKLVDKGFLERISAYYEDYEKGHLDIYEYEAFLLGPLTLLTPAECQRLLKEYLLKIRKALRPRMLRQLRRHRAGGHIPLLVTASNNFIAGPIAELLGFNHLICTKIKRNGEAYTTELDGIPAFREGKVWRLEQWLAETKLTLENSWGYSDSHNDLPLLQLMTHPVAVTPDALLEQHARQQGWKIITL
jgi:HAD superfamily hydrolase (TIGR01490 family)